MISFSHLSAQIFNASEFNQDVGLSNEFNFYFSIDQEGFFWTSSKSGINRFDGISNKVYRPNLDMEITSQVFTDTRNNKWFTSNNALNCIIKESDSLQSWQLSENKNSYHYAFHLEKDSFLWTVANQQLFVINLYDSLENVLPIHSYNTYLAYAIEDTLGAVKQLVRPLMLEGEYGFELSTYENESFKRDSFFTKQNIDVFPSVPVTFLHVENANSLWIPSEKGLIHFDPKQAEKFKIYNFEQRKVKFDDIAIWKERYVLLSSWEKGLFIFDKITHQFYKYENNFLVNGRVKKLLPIHKIHIDAKNNLWMSVFNEGLYFLNLDNQKFKTFFSHDKLFINSIQEYGERIFCHTTTKGIFELSKQNYSLIESGLTRALSNNSSGSSTQNIFYDNNDNIWTLSENQIIVKTFGGEKEITLQNIKSFDIKQLSDSSFLAFDDRFIYEINIEGKTQIATDTFAKVDLPAYLFFDKKSELIFFSQSDNTFKVFDYFYHNDSITILDNVGIIHNIHRSIDQDFIWLASSTGLYQFYPDSRTAEKVIDKHGMLDKTFTAVVEDSIGNVWLSSYYGIYRYLPDQQKVEHFTESDGLISMQYVENSSLYASNGKIYFGGDRGVTVIDPCNVQLNPNLPNIELTEAYINNEPFSRSAFLDTTQVLKLNRKQNSIELQFAVLEFSDPERNGFRYELIRNKKDTLRKSKNANPVKFNFLSSGQYELHLYASNSDDVWTTDPKVIYFRILPHLLLRWWTIAIELLLLFVILYGIYRYRIRQIKRQEAAKRREAELKQEAAELKQLATEREMATLRVQMNPHFIYNVMTSIGSYILEKDKFKAYDYLGMFANLMRTVLNKAKKNLIPLSEEYQLLELYIQTEALRFEEKLQYQFTIDPDLDLDDYSIPPMLLQPFIENAIKHGLSPKTEGGLLQIRFLLKGEEQLLCEIEDDGVGRAFHKNRTKTHQSKGLKITKNRLEILSNKYKIPTYYQIIDLYDADKQAIGTKVQVFLPLI